jgi:DNA modification methylase
MNELTWHIKKRNLSELKPWDKNPRQISKEHYERLKQRIVARGFHDVLKLDENDIVLSGNQRLRALIELGRKEANCIIPDRPMTEEEKDKVGLESNINDGETDFDVLANNFDMDLLRDVGFSDNDLQIESPEVEEDEVPNIDDVEPMAKLGDIWQLGKHRIICGDCCLIDCIDELFNGLKVSMVLTDPPYGVDYSGKNEFLNKFDKGNRNQTPIENDAIENYRQFFNDFLSFIPLQEYNTFYIFMSGQKLHELRLSFDDCDMKFGDYLVWVKNNHVLGRKDYHAKHEFCVYGWKGKHKFYGDFSTTILEFDKPLKNDLHPTMKPIVLLVKLIKDGSQRKDIIYDPFLGSGSTLIACEQTDRICYGCEIEPKYIDVIIARWEKFTGQKAKKIN